MSERSNHGPAGPVDIDRRAALQLMASGAALALASCGRPAEEIVPYVNIPERLTPGIPLRFASTLALAGFGRGVIVASVEGRPIKIDGNPRHPASLGATDVFAEAALLSLYDPDRSKAVRRGTGVYSWDAFEAALRTQLAAERRRDGSGLRILVLSGSEMVSLRAGRRRCRARRRCARLRAAAQRHSATGRCPRRCYARCRSDRPRTRADQVRPRFHQRPQVQVGFQVGIRAGPGLPAALRGRVRLVSDRRQRGSSHRAFPAARSQLCARTGERTWRSRPDRRTPCRGGAVCTSSRCRPEVRSGAGPGAGGTQPAAGDSCALSLDQRPTEGAG